MPGTEVLQSWDLHVPVILLLLSLAFLYTRGWVRAKGSPERLAAFIGGLAILFIALESPLDTFGGLFLWVHMTQHVLLMTVAPLLIMLGRPQGMLIRGLPVAFVKEGLGPFFLWPALRRFTRRLTSPVTAFVVFAATMIVWHLPRFYQLALESAGWHKVQHACFFQAGILFWIPVLEGHPRVPRWFGIPYLLLADILNTAFSAFLVFSGRLLYPVYSNVRIGSMSAADDQVIAGAVMWVPGSIFFLIPAIAIAYRLLARPSERRVAAHRYQPGAAWPSIDLRPVRRLGRPVMLAGALIIAAGGFAGSRLAVSATWIHWRALSILALLVCGNLFCMTCPLTLARDAARKWFPPRAVWPSRLRNKWLAVGLFSIYLWGYGTFALWDRPVATAWIIVGYFAAILLVDCTFTGAVFCKYVCPVGQFNFVMSSLSPREIGVRDRAVCRSCRTHDCVKGNDAARGCELALFQPTKVGNLDCTFCLDCVSACPSSNVALMPLTRLSTLMDETPRSGIGKVSRRIDIVALAAVFVLGAFVNASGMLAVRVWVRVVFVAVPVIAAALCLAANRAIVGEGRATEIGRRSVLSLVPLGAAIWAAHLLYHALPALSGTTLHQLQILMLDGGVLMSIAALWKTANRIILATPWILLSLLLYAVGVWILFQPMQMIGMSM